MSDKSLIAINSPLGNIEMFLKNLRTHLRLSQAHHQIFQKAINDVFLQSNTAKQAKDAISLVNARIFVSVFRILKQVQNLDSVVYAKF